MIPKTLHGCEALALVSAMQKHIRRGQEREAMECAVELMHSSRAFLSMVCKRLQVISHEDIDTEASPWIAPFVYTVCTQIKEWYDPDPMKLGKIRMAIGNAIRMMCRAPKSREGDHFHTAIGLANLLETKVPEIPDWAYDKHTMKGKRMGRGLEHFREIGTQLVPPPARKDPYEDEAYRLWALKDQAAAEKKTAQKGLDLEDETA